jgi:hypothetical protein
LPTPVGEGPARPGQLIKALSEQAAPGSERGLEIRLHLLGIGH